MHMHMLLCSECRVDGEASQHGLNRMPYDRMRSHARRNPQAFQMVTRFLSNALMHCLHSHWLQWSCIRSCSWRRTYHGKQAVVVNELQQRETLACMLTTAATSSLNEQLPGVPISRHL